MADRYIKAPGYVGKELTLYVGGGDRKIMDGVVYQGRQYGKFVGMGFLVPAPSQEEAEKRAPAAKPVPKPAPAKEPEKADSDTSEPAAKADEGSVTKSPDAPTPKKTSKRGSKKSS